MIYLKMQPNALLIWQNFIIAKNSVTLQIKLSGCDILLIEAVYFFFVIVAVGHDCGPSGVPLLPLLAALSAFLGALASGFGWCCSATIEVQFSIA
jgi:hypothetical protein